MNMKYKFRPFVMAMLCLLSAASAQQIPLDPAVKTGKLSNGFTYYIRKNNEPQKRVQLYLVNDVGSVLEDDDQQGLAHFLEHMNFNGTKNFPKNQLVDYLQKAGIRFGADLNAHTGPDETVYQLPIPTDDPAMLKHGLQIMRDWAQEATLDPAEIEKERGIVMEEGRLAKGAKDRMMRRYIPMMVNNSRYAGRFPIGLDSILLHFKPAVIKRFHQDWYRPDLQALIVVGDVNVTEVEKLIKTHFSDLKMPAKVRPRTHYKVLLTGKNQYLAVTDPEMSGTTLEILFKHTAANLSTEQDYLQMMKQSLFGRMLASRRNAEISRQNNSAFSNMNAVVQPLMGGLEMFVFEVNAKEGQLQKAFEQSWGYLEKLKKFGFTKMEFEQAKQNYLRTFETALKEKDKTPSVNYVTEYQALYLHQQAAPGIDWEYNFVKSNIDKISVEGINDLFKGYLKDTDRDMLLLAPEKDKNSLPDEATVMNWISTVSKSEQKPFAEEKVSMELLAQKPVPGKVVQRKLIPEIGATELVLSNGVKVILKPTDFKNDQIMFKGFSPGGTSLYDDAAYDNAANAAALISRFGLGSFNPNQLSQALSNKVLNVTANIELRAQTVTGSSSVADLETALQVAYLQFTQPRKDTLMFRNIISSSKASFEGRYADPMNVFSDTISRVMGNYSYRLSPSSPQRIEKISLDKVYEIYKDRFADASGFTFVFVGNFDAAIITPLIEQYLGGLPSLNRNEKTRDLGIHIPEGQLVKKVYKGAENKALVRLVFSGNYTYSPQNNLLLKALGDILQVKILENLREKEGEVYSPTVQTSYAKNPRNRYAMIINFGCDPKNADHLVNEVAKEMQAMKHEGVSTDDVQKFKAAYGKNVELALKDNGFWLNYLSSQYENQEDILEVLDADKNLSKVSPEAIRKAAASFFSEKNRITFMLLPGTSATK
jgi:zinc protease